MVSSVGIVSQQDMSGAKLHSFGKEFLVDFASRIFIYFGHDP
jgi:hypothetical protein